VSIICPVCSRRVDYRSLIKGMCIECYAKENPLVKVRKDPIKFCPRCGRVYHKRGWSPSGEEILKKIVIQRIKPIESDLKLSVLDVYDLREKKKKHEKGKSYLAFKVGVKLLGLEGEIRVEREYEIPIMYEVCDGCIKRSSGYYESVLRIKKSSGSFSVKEERGILREVENLLSKRGEGAGFIVKYEKKRDILEFKLSSNSSAKSIASLFRRKYGAKVRIDSKLHTRKEGKNFYRLSILVEIPPKSLRVKNS